MKYPKFRETCLSTSARRLVLAAPLATGTLSTALPANAANFNVGSEADLRSAINNAHNGDTISFTANITLSADLPHLQSTVTINGGNFTLSGNNQHRGLVVQSGKVAVNDLTIASTKAQGGNGANGAGEDGGGGGGAGMGGALFVANGANVTVSNVSLKDNLAHGGNGAAASGGDRGGGGGGGMFGSGTAANGGTPGQGGAGGGGNGGAPVNNPGAPGGFGGAGGGGAGREPGGTGGFGGGGGGSFNNGSPGSGGFGGGSGNAFDHGGGGGAGLGGAIFVQQGGTLTLAGSLAISGNAVAGGNAGTGRATSGQGFGSGIFLQGNGSFTIAPGAGQTQTISDAIADQTGVAGSGGSWSLVKNGDGTTILTGENAYSGGATINAGVLQGNTSSLKGNIVFDPNAGNPSARSVTFDQATNGEFGGGITGIGSLAKTGGGDLALTGANTYTGGTTVNGGALLFATDASLGAAGTAISLNNGTIGTLGLDSLTIARPITITNTGGIRVDQFEQRVRPLTWSGVIGGNGRLTKSGVGDLILSGANTYMGGTTVTEGVLRFTNDANLGAAGTGITLAGGAVGTTANTPAASSNGRSITLAGSGGIDVSLHPFTWSGNIDGTGQFIKSGNGELELTGNNTYTGGTLVQRGNLRIASDDKLGATGTGITLNDTGTLRTAASFTSARPISMTGAGGAFQVDDGMTMTLSGIVSGTNLTKIDRGTLVLTGANTYTGNTNVFGGTVQGSTASIRGNIVFDPNKDNLFARSVTFDQATDGTFAGNITNKGSITKTGAGTLTLSGNNSYTDGTTVSAGTLEGTTRSLQGNILNNAAVIFDQGFDGAYAGAMTGAGALTKNGTGKLTLTANNTVGGGTTLNAGGLALNGILHSNVTMNGGVLSGVGNIDGSLTQNGGEIAPGNSIGNFTINGNFTVNRGILEFEINPNGTSDRITVTGAGHKATLNGGTVEVVALPGVYTPNTVYTIVATSGGVVGTFANVTEDLAFLTPTLSYDPNNVYLSLLLAPNAFAAAGQTPNQQAVGGGLDAMAASGNVGGIVTAMANLGSGQGAPALEALTGEVHASVKGALLEDSRFVREAALDRTRAAFAGVAAPTLPVMGYGPGGAAPAAPDAPFAVWTRGFGSWGERESDGNATDFERSIGGLFVGADALVAETWRVGLLAGHSRSSFDADDRASSGDSDNYHLGLYGGTRWGNLDLRLSAAHSWHDIETSRSIAFPGLADSAQASYDARTAQLFGELGYQINRSGFAFEPFANLAYVNVHTDGFTEAGGAAALTSASSNTDATFTTLGLRAATNFRLGETEATARGMVGWRHAFGDVIPTATNAFAGSNAFTIAGTPIAEDALVLEAGLDFGLTDKASLGVSYSGQIASKASDHGFRADLTVKF